MPFSRSFLSEDQLLCSICLDVFDNPVSTPCGHSFCMSCIGHYWDTAKHCQCPLCKQAFKRKPDLHINRTLREITEQFKRMTGHPEGGEEPENGETTQTARDGTLKRSQLPGHIFNEMKKKLIRHRSRGSSHACHEEMVFEQINSPDAEGGGVYSSGLERSLSQRRFTLSGAADAVKVPLCPKHHRNLDLFCRTDLECVCVECGQSEHQSHDITCAEREWESNKMQISITETEIQQMTNVRMQKAEEIKQSVVNINALVEQESQRCMQMFRALIVSLERSHAGLLELTEFNRRSVEHQAEVMTRELEQETAELRQRSDALAKLAQTEDYITGLKGYSEISSPVSMKDWTGVSLNCDLGTKAICASVCQLLDQFKAELQKLPSAVCLPVSAIQSPLKSHPKVKRIQEYAMNVTLDPNTAHPRLILSEDKKQVWCSDKQQHVPYSHQRFDRVVCVLGVEGFSSGRHYWEVEVTGKTDWDLGIASQSCNRKGKITVSPSNGYWFLSLRDRNTYAFRTEPSTTLPLSLKPQKIGLFVDYEKGQLSFYNVDAKVQIYTFMDKFSETIYPFFSPCTSKTGRNEAPLVITPVYMN